MDGGIEDRTGTSCALKVIHVVYELTPGTFTGGVSKMVYELAIAQNQLGIDVSIWTVGAAKSEVKIGSLNLRTFQGNRLFGVAYSKQLAHELRKLAMSSDLSLVVHAHNTFHPLNLQVCRALAGTRARLFYSPHGALDPTMMCGHSLKALKKRAYVAFFEKRYLSAADGLFALTLNEHAQLSRLGLNVPIDIIPNGIAAVSPPANERSTSRGTSLGFIGRINPKKGLHHLLRALKCLHDSHPDTTLTIAGNRSQFPSYAQALDRLARDLGVTASLRWTGFLDEEGKRALLSEIDIFVHASDSEGMPMAILEAMEAGVPCVVTPGCYMRHAAESGAVLEVEQSPHAIARALARLIDEPNERKRLGASGQQHAWTTHLWPTIANLYVKSYILRKFKKNLKN